MNKYPGGVGCPYDYVQIYAGNDTTGRSLGKFCGTDAPDPVSSSGSMFIQFVTDRNQAFSGFRAQYRVTGKVTRYFIYCRFVRIWAALQLITLKQHTICASLSLC